jgi:hypothetical protein
MIKHMKKNISWDFTQLLQRCNVLPQDIESLAIETGFCQRNSGKIDPVALLEYLLSHSIEGTVTYTDMASTIEANTGINASPQAYHKRMNDALVRFVRSILEDVMASKIQNNFLNDNLEKFPYQRILIQDSTLIKLPKRLFEIFSGVKNASTQSCHARIQATFDLLSGKFIAFSIDPYSRNDLTAAYDLDVLPNDLILRDRGYFIPACIQKHKDMNAECILRYQSSNALFCPKTEEPIDLLQLLSKNGSVDMPVLLGSSMVPVRLIAAPVPEEIANTRRMKAKQENKGHNPSQKLLALMSWSIFITTIEEVSIAFELIYALYSLRWRIENIFKTWKSNFNFSKVHCVSENQLRVLLYSRLTSIVMLYQHMFLPLSNIIYKKSGEILSLMKFMTYFNHNVSYCIQSITPRSFSKELIYSLEKYSTYQKRKRINFTDKMMEAFQEVEKVLG